MAAKTWEEDYRYPAIQASIRQLGDIESPDLFQTPSSFCLPVGNKPLVGWTPGYFMVIFLFLGFGLMFGGMLLSTISQNQPAPLSGILLSVAAFTSLSGLAMFFIPLKLDRQIVSLLLGERGQQLVRRASMKQIMTAEVTHADQSAMKISISGDDYALIFPDAENRRILMEGIGARYQIRAEDVELIEPFQFMNYLGVSITYRIIPDTPLKLAIARPSLVLELIRQLPFLFFLKCRIGNKFYERFSTVLSKQET